MMPFRLLTELWLIVRARLHFGKAVRKYFGFLSRDCDWVTKDIAANEVWFQKGPFTIQFTFRVEGPARLGINLLIDESVTNTNPELRAGSKETGQLGPFRIEVLAEAWDPAYLPQRMDLTPNSWSELNRALAEAAPIIERYATALTPDNVALLRCITRVQADRNLSYHIRTLLEIAGPDLAAQWRGKSADEIRMLYEQWAAGVLKRPPPPDQRS